MNPPATDCLQRIALQPVVHINEGFPFVSGLLSFADQLFANGPPFGLRFLHAVIRLKRFHRLLVIAPWFEQKSGGAETWICSAALDRQLFTHRRHGVPGIEDMGDSVTGKTREIIRLQPMFISHLHGIGPALGELP